MRTRGCAGTSPGTILSASSRHVALLHKTRLAVDDGASAEEAFKRSYLHFSREKPIVTASANCDDIACSRSSSGTSSGPAA